jgi:hypothetical protein
VNLVSGALVCRVGGLCCKSLRGFCVKYLASSCGQFQPAATIESEWPTGRLVPRGGGNVNQIQIKHDNVNILERLLSNSKSCLCLGSHCDKSETCHFFAWTNLGVRRRRLVVNSFRLGRVLVDTDRRKLIAGKLPCWRKRRVAQYVGLLHTSVAPYVESCDS